jgi:hypothetical protein
MISFTFKDGSFVVEPVVTAADLDMLDGGAGCGARLRPQPIMPTDCVAIAPQVAGVVWDQPDQVCRGQADLVGPGMRTLASLAG